MVDFELYIKKVLWNFFSLQILTKGLFSGSAGEFVILRKEEEPETDNEQD